MTNEKNPTPRNYKGVTISSTFTDLKDHRDALIKGIKGQGLTDVAMENDSAKLLDVIDSSLQMVQDGSAYIGVIGRKYGQIPKCPRRNPGNVSITELEFNEAQRLNRPILLFIMGEEHQLRERDIESSAAKKKKLNAFREQAKKMGPDSSVHRVYATFDSLDEFKEKSIHAIAGLRRYLDDAAESSPQGPPLSVQATSDLIPEPPNFYAQPPYIGSHQFVGRQAELERLSDWAAPADAHSILLFEAIGGAGKSMLTWEWTTKHGATVRRDWAGRFWYSFYEKGAIMADFCQHALAYMTKQPLESFRKRRTQELGELLLHQLQARPWLLILDGLERVLVAYHRFDAAQVADEQVDSSKDQIAVRDPCASIRPEDDDLLRALAAAAPSKLLITTRLTPRILLNPSRQGIQGVLRVPLPGLRPADAEALLRLCGVTGDSEDIQNYLKYHCDCHPLVTGVLAGLINDYLPERGNFDRWSVDPDGGGKLNLANIDLVQKRNNILHAALNALPDKSHQLLSILALLSESVDYSTLSALNPQLPPEPEVVEKPQKPPELEWEELLSDEERQSAQSIYQASLSRYEKYQAALIAWRRSPEFRGAQEELRRIVRDLESRGLLQYDAQAKRYDLHPVVRGVAAGWLLQEEKEQFGQRVVDHFSRQAHSPYEVAETFEDIRDGLNIVRILLQMGRKQMAFNAYRGNLAHALFTNLEAYAEVLSLIQPFFPHGWSTKPEGVTEADLFYLEATANHALLGIGEAEEALGLYGASLLSCLRRGDWMAVVYNLSYISTTLFSLSRFARQERNILLALGIVTLRHEEPGQLFMVRLDQFRHLGAVGRYEEAEALWRIIDSMDRPWARSMYTPGMAEYDYAQFSFWRGTLTEEHLAHAEQLAKAGKNRPIIRRLHALRGEWQLEQRQWQLAADSLSGAIRMAREIGQSDPIAEAQLALAKFNLCQLPGPHHEAEQLAKSEWSGDRAQAELWLAIGDRKQAKGHALAAYQGAWADGEPYVWRYELNKARALLEQLGAEIPDLPVYDPAKDERLPWEDEVTIAIEKLRAQKEAQGVEEED